MKQRQGGGERERKKGLSGDPDNKRVFIYIPGTSRVMRKSTHVKYSDTERERIYPTPGVRAVLFKT